jgi:hypothetical protein
VFCEKSQPMITRELMFVKVNFGTCFLERGPRRYLLMSETVAKANGHVASGQEKAADMANFISDTKRGEGCVL